MDDMMTDLLLINDDLDALTSTLQTALDQITVAKAALGQIIGEGE